MSGKAPRTKGSEIQWDTMGNMPGFANAPQGAIPYFIQSGLLDLVAAVANQAAYVFPVNATILSIRWRVRVAVDATSVARVGDTTTAARFASTTILTTDVAGSVIAATILDASPAAGDALVFGGDGGATAAGSVDGTVIWTPR